MACILKTTGLKTKRTESWDSLILVTRLWGTFVALVLNWPVTRKRLVVKQNVVKTNWDSETLPTHIWNTYDLVGSKVILGDLIHFFSKWPELKKGLSGE